MGKREGTINITDTHVGVWEKHVDEGLAQVLEGASAFLVARGWTIGTDPYTEQHFPTLSPFTRAGAKGSLQIILELRGRHLAARLFHGDKRGFDKISKIRTVSTALWIKCITEMTALTRYYTECGYSLERRGGPRDVNALGVRDLAEGRVGDALQEFNERWSSHRFERDESGWPSHSEIDHWKREDRDGKVITQCATRHIRLRGRLLRVQCCGGINDMWHAVSNGSILSYNQPSWEFFECKSPDLEPRRVAPNSVQRQKEELEKAIARGDVRKIAALKNALGPKRSAHVTETAGKTHRFKMEAVEGDSWSVWLIDEDTRTLTIFGDYGNWSYTWGYRRDRQPFGLELLSFGADYIWGKLEGHAKTEFNVEATKKTIRESILDIRRTLSIDRRKAAELWEDLDYVDGECSFQDYLHKHDSYDWWELASYDPVHDAGLKHLMDVTLPRFKKAVRERFGHLDMEDVA